jgi:rod shape-determining protein MreD
MMLDPRSVSAPPSDVARVLFVFLLLVCTAFQGVFSFRMTLWGGQPDFILTLALVAALLSDAVLGCYVGFAAGLATAALAGETVGTYLVSRTIAGCVAGGLTSRLFRGNLGVVFLVVLLASLVAQALYGLAAPPQGHIAGWLKGAALGAVWNAVISLPLTYLLRLCGWGKGRL